MSDKPNPTGVPFPPNPPEAALDDGERLEFDRVELLSALGTVIAGDMGRLRAA